MDFYDYGIANIPVSIIGLIINCLALYCLWKSNRGLELSNANLLLLALNLWDTFTCLVLLPTKCIYYTTTEQSDKPSLLRYTGAINTWCSNFLITLIAFNRYLAVSRPLRYKTILSKERVSLLLATSMFVGLVGPTMVFNHIRVFGTISVIVYILNLCVIFVLYCLILKKVNVARSSISSTRNNKRLTRRQLHVSLNVVILLTTYITCLSCHYTFILILLTKGTRQSAAQIDIGVMIFNMNSICNPVIYVLRSSSYRRVLKNLFRCRQRRRINRIAVLDQQQVLPPPMIRVAEAQKQ